jgi:hypothetical protein
VPRVLARLVQQTLTRALAVASDRREARPARHGAARVAASLIPGGVESERGLADVASAVLRSADDATVSRALLDALKDVAPVQDYVRFLVRAVDWAAAEGFAGTGRILMIAAVREPLLFVDVDDAWMTRTLAAVAGSGPNAEILKRHALSKAVRTVGAGREWIRALVQAEPHLLHHPSVTVDVLFALHAAHPSVEGWRVLASQCTDPVFPVSFGDSHAEALDTLRDAVATAPDTATRAVLGAWLSELASR